MLTPKQIEEAADTLIPIWDELKEWITLDLIERILSRLGGEDITLSSSEKWRLRVFEELGGLLNELHRRLLETTRISEQELRRVFIGYGEKSVEDDAAVFSDEENAPDSSDGRSHFLGKAFEGEDEQTPAGQKSPSQSRTGGENGIDDKPQEKPLDRMSDRMKDIMNDAYTRTNGELRNFTGTTADSVQTRFIEELDKAYLKVSSNAVSQWQAAQQAVDDLIKTQGYVTYPSGHVDTIEVAVIRAIRTGMARMSTALALEGAKEHGWNHVIVSSHIGARVGDGGENPGNHAWWQGKVYTIDGESEEFPNLEKATGYPSDPHGLSGYNCRHSARPFDPSRMKNNFPKYGEEENNEYYELTQRQREFERKIRRAKTEVAAYSRALAESRDEQLAESFQAKLEDAKAKLAKLNDDYKAFCGENGFRVAYERIYAARGRVSKTANSGGEESTPPSVAKSAGSGIIKSIDVDDYELVTYGKGIEPEVSNVIVDTMKQCEKFGGFTISEVSTNVKTTTARGRPVLQIEPMSNGLLKLNVNVSFLSGKSLQEINEIFLNSENTVVNSLKEAVIHESGHAISIKGKTSDEIEKLYEKLGTIHFDGVSDIALSDGAECLAELEVLRSRGVQVSNDLIEFYTKYMGRDYL